MRILIIEDVDTKYDEVEAIVRQASMRGVDIVRAANLNDAEDQIMAGGWDLVVLDLSMDIAAQASPDYNSGHASLGGLDVLERMSLLKIHLPTVLVTGFDSFQDPDRFDNAIMNLSDVDDLAAAWLKSSYLGCVRYGSERWQQNLADRLSHWGKA